MRQLLRLLLVPVLALAGLALPGSGALASCAQRTPAERIASADVIAYGRLVSIRMTFAPASPVVTFRPERILKGALGGDVEVFFGPSHGGAITSVDYAGAPPESHTLYLRLVDGGYETDACSGSHSGTPADGETAALGEGALVSAASGERIAPLVVGAALAALLATALAVVIVRRRTA